MEEKLNKRLFEGAVNWFDVTVNWFYVAIDKIDVIFT